MISLLVHVYVYNYRLVKVLQDETFAATHECRW